QPDRLPIVEPAPVRVIYVPRPAGEHSAVRARAAAPETEQVTASPDVETPKEPTPPATVVAAPPRAAPVQERPLTLWPARVSQGASGRLVQIGAFGTRFQAKLGWWHMVRAYPALRRLPAVVVEARNSRRRPFYRFQI